MIRTVPFWGALLLSVASFAQVNEHFENGISNLSNHCWQFSNLNYATKVDNSVYVINGNGSIYSDPPVNSSNFRTITSPYLNVQNNLTLTFQYKLSSALKNNATRIIQVGLQDKNGAVTILKAITLNGTSSTGAQSFTISNQPVVAGVYRIVIKLGGSLGDGNSRLSIDDLVIDANYHYAGICNSSPAATNDSYETVKSNSGFNGQSLLLNDQDPDGETLTAILVDQSPDGDVTINSDGSFSFLPNASFRDSVTHFTYRVTDNGYDAAFSNIAQVTIKFEDPNPVIIRIVDFSGASKNGKVQLKWQVGLNEMIEHFEIERSADGTAFTTTNLINATTKAGDEKYNESEPVNDARQMYRLKLVSRSGEIKYSGIIMVNAEQSDNFQHVIVSNPVISSMMINYPSPGRQGIVATVYNANGSGITSTRFFASQGLNHFSLDLSNLKPGVYMLAIFNEKNEKYSSIFVKQ